jgi:hypothetical protein
MDEEEQQRVNEQTPWILLGMPKTTAYMTVTMEYRKDGKRIMA